MLNAVLVYFNVFLLAQSGAIYRRWLPNTDFGNSQNWNAGRAPCGNDIVIIGEDSPIVYVQTNTTMKELVLPTTGELILGREVSLGFTSEKPDESDCPDFDGDVEFSATEPASWMDKDSWCDTTTERGACNTAWRLDVENVPCKYDDVIFPRDHGYFVDISDMVAGMAVKSLKITGSSMSTQTFATFLNETEGKLMFRSGTSSPSLTITRKQCDDKGGCACGNDQPEISKKICDHVKKNCDRPRCRKSVMPVGMCCRYCGAYFNITKGYGFDLELFKSTLSKEFLDNQKDVNNIIAVMTGDWVQLVLSDTTGENSKKLAASIRDDLNKDLADGGHKYAIKGFQLFMETIAPDVSSQPSTSSLSGGSIAAIVICIIILLIIVGVVLVVFVYRRTG
ncbi:protein amnionless-like [Elysia marginata]|uniref:Protein amnionless n=1 Tax=Elysia marginata TaxID=1093978 RepID=A0AAV4F2F7_9GAST|nr:protein amnionless-like [Elysia marginata]